MNTSNDGFCDYTVYYCTVTVWITGTVYSPNVPYSTKRMYVVYCISFNSSTRILLTSNASYFCIVISRYVVLARVYAGADTHVHFSLQYIK